MRVAITGGTGSIGSHLAAALEARGDEVLIVTRKPPRRDNYVQWTVDRGIIAPARLEGVHAVVNLAGAPLATRPWTRRRQQVLRDSRVKATGSLFKSLARLDEPPRVFVGAGHLGLFGDRGEELVSEHTPPAEGFLAELAGDWERAQLDGAEALGCRGAVVRMNIVLAPDGQLFPALLLPFRNGFGGWLGDGTQWLSWLSVRDAVGIMLHVIDHGEAHGAYNATVPEPVRQRAWCEAPGVALQRRLRLGGGAPRWALRGAFGPLADSILLSSMRAVPQRLLEEGYTFRDTDPEETFRWLVRAHDALNS